MTSQGFRTCKQALWSSFQAYARAEKTPFVDDAQEDASASAALSCLCLDRGAFESAVSAFVQTPDLARCFPYEDPLVVTAALSQLQHRPEVREALWTTMLTNTAALEALPGEDGRENPACADSVLSRGVVNDPRMTITLPFELDKGFGWRRADHARSPSPISARDGCGINWTCYQCTLFTFLNDALRCHVEPAALRQCRRDLVADGERAAEEDTVRRTGRHSLGLVPESMCASPTTALVVATAEEAIRSPCVYRDAAWKMELQQMLKANSLPRGAEAEESISGKEGHHGEFPQRVCERASPILPLYVPHEDDASVPLCSASTGTSGTAERASSPPARVVEAAEWARFRTQLQLSGQRTATADGHTHDDDAAQAAGVAVLEGSCDVPSPSPIHSRDRDQRGVYVRGGGGGVCAAHVSVSPPTSTVRGRSTIEISVDLNEDMDEDEDEKEEGEMTGERTSLHDAVSDPVIVANQHHRRSSPPRRPAAACLEVKAFSGGLRQRSSSQSNQCLAAKGHDVNTVKKPGQAERDGKGENHARTPQTPLGAQTGAVAPTSQPLQCIRTRGGAAAAAAAALPVAVKAQADATPVLPVRCDVEEGVRGAKKNSQTDALEDEDVDEEESEGRRTTALTLEGFPSDTPTSSPGEAVMPRPADADDHFDPAAKSPQQPEPRHERPAAALAQPQAPPQSQRQPQRHQQQHVASAPSPSMTPCEREEDRPWRDASSGHGTAVPPPPAKQGNRAQPPPLRTPRRGQLPEPHHAPQQRLNPAYNGVAPAHLVAAQAHHSSRNPHESPNTTTTAPPVVGVPFLVRSVPHTPRHSATANEASSHTHQHASQNHAQQPQEQQHHNPRVASRAEKGQDVSPRRVPRGRGGESGVDARANASAKGVSFSHASGVEAPKARPSSRTCGSGRMPPATPPPPPPPRPPSRDRRARGGSAASSPRSRASGSGRGSGCVPAVPHSRASSSRAGSGRASTATSSLYATTPPPPRTPSRHASPFFRMASQTSPPTPPPHRPRSPLNPALVGRGSANRREPFYESAAGRCGGGVVGT